MRKLLIFIPILFFAVLARGQAQDLGILNYAVVLNQDTVPNIYLKPVYIVDYKKFPSEKARIKYTRLVKYVKIVYPYAKLAGQKLQEYDKQLRAAKNDRERKKLMKKAEKEIRDEYEGRLRKLTRGQGRILVKLLYRETHNSAYDLLKELRGTVSAALWQGVGKLFGYNLKVGYDPAHNNADRQIEQIVRLIEKGAI
jgi:hypothetical protein